MRIGLIALYSSRFPSIGESHSLSVLAGVAQACRKPQLEHLSVFDMVSVSEEAAGPLLEYLRTAHPDLLGISVPYGSCSFLVREWLRIRKEVGEQCWIVLGGAIPTCMAKRMVSQLPGAIAVLGEGEIAFAKLISCRLADDRSRLASVPGIVFSEGRVLHETPRELVDLSVVPQPFRMHVGEIVRGGGQIFCEIGRGCSWAACRFCLRGLTDCDGKSREYRRFPANRIADDLLEIYRHGARHVTFADEDLLGTKLEDLLWVVNTLEKARSRLPGRFEFDASVMPHSVFSVQMSTDETEERLALLQRLRKCGCRKVFLGVESGANTQLRRLAKAHSAVEAIQAIRRLRRIGVSVEIGWIMFDPLCTLEELLENARFIRDHNLVPSVSFLFSELRLLTGTRYVRLLEHAEEVSGAKLYSRSVCADTLSHDYRYLDRDVERIVEETRNWTASVKPLHYPLKNLCRFGDGSILGACFAQGWSILTELRWRLFEAFEQLLAGQASGNVADVARSAVGRARERAAESIIDLLEQLPEDRQEQHIVAILKKAAKMVVEKEGV